MWIRTASKRDIAPISKLLGLVWHHTYDRIYGRDKVDDITRQWHGHEALEKLLNAPSSEFLVADNGNTIVGMAYARQIDEKKAKLHQLYVMLEFQGRGVGKLLLDEIEVSFFDVAAIVLEVEEQNLSAIRFYEKYGFRQSGKTTDCGALGAGITALIFEKCA
jgi:ribosomal protein S18 acetylase RimI-like enzyme